VAVSLALEDIYAKRVLLRLMLGGRPVHVPALKIVSNEEKQAFDEARQSYEDIQKKCSTGNLFGTM
jgi:L-alanine-DL-glutamate epimerase-like enolase superfamily enzyme